jgi:hypothetical protein
METDSGEQLSRQTAVGHASGSASEPSPLVPRPAPLALRPSSLIFLAIWLTLMLVGRSDMFRDPGTFWHVAAGKKMLAAGQVIREDPFSFTRAGKPWVADQWLAECGMAAVHDLAGWDGLLLVTATLLAGIYAWIAARLLRGGLHWLPTVLLTAVAVCAGAPQFHVRPLVATIGLLAVTFAWLVDVETGSRRLRQLWWLVPLFLLWTNVHGGMLGGLGTVAICFAGWSLVTGARASRPPSSDRAECPSSSKRAGRPRSEVIESAVLLIALAATMLVSPYGWALPREWLDTLAMPLPSLIEEHARLDWSEPIGRATLALGTVYLATLIGVLPRWPRVTWLVPLVWFVLAVLRVRNVPLFGITAAIAMADMLPHSSVGRWLARRGLLAQRSPVATLTKETQPSPPTPLPKGEGSWGGGIFVPIVVVVAAALIQIGGVRLPVVGRGWVEFDSARWPIELLPELGEIDRSSQPGTRIFNDMNLGGFVIYHAPRLRVFVDDRCPLYGAEFLLDYDRARHEDPAWIERWQREYGFGYAFVSTLAKSEDGMVQSPFERYLSQSAGWRLVARSPAAALYRHK